MVKWLASGQIVGREEMLLLQMRGRVRERERETHLGGCERGCVRACVWGGGCAGVGAQRGREMR